MKLTYYPKGCHVRFDGEECIIKSKPIKQTEKFGFNQIYSYNIFKIGDNETFKIVEHEELEYKLVDNSIVKYYIQILNLVYKDDTVAETYEEFEFLNDSWKNAHNSILKLKEMGYEFKDILKMMEQGFKEE